MLENFIRKVIENHWPVLGIEVFYQGHVIDKYDFVPEGRHPVYSATKAFTSTAAGIAADEGKFPLEASLYYYFGDKLPDDISEEQVSVLKKITMKRLLTMSVPGYPFRPEGDNWLKASLSYPIKLSETPVFDYSNIPAYLVGAAVEKAVGMHLAEYLDSRLFQPLGIEDPEFRNCPSGHFYGASGMSLTVNELGKLGRLYLQNGIFNGKRIISEKWVKEATQVQVMNEKGGYGYYFWKYRDGFLINGKWGQKCYVLPGQQLMVTYLADIKEGPDVARLTMEEEILPQFEL